MKETSTIITEIKSGIPKASYGEQVRYLQQRTKEYANHPDAKIIEKACNRLIGELMPEEKKKAIYEQIFLELNSVNEKLNQARELIRNKDYSSALEITMSLSEMADIRPIIEDDGESAYYNFSEEFERVIYLEIERQNGRSTDESLKETPFPYFDIYGLNGTCLLEMGQYREAAEEFKKASYWNPASAYVRFQYVRVIFELGAGKKTWSLSVDNMKYMFRRYDISQCYFHLGHCYKAGGEMEAAIACFLLSDYYTPDKERRIDTKEMMKETGLLNSHFTSEKMYEISKKYRFPLEPEKTAAILALENGVAIMDDNPKLAVYYLRIANDLSDAPEIKYNLAIAEKKLEALNQQTDKE